MILSTIVSIIFIVIIVILFFTLTIINLKTKKPEGCEEETEACNTCSYRCIHNANFKNDKKSE